MIWTTWPHWVGSSCACGAGCAAASVTSLERCDTMTRPPRPPRDPLDDQLWWALRTNDLRNPANQGTGLLSILAMVVLFKFVPWLAQLLLLMLPAPCRAACVFLGRLLGTLLCLVLFVLVGFLFAMIVVHWGGR